MPVASLSLHGTWWCCNSEITIQPGSIEKDIQSTVWYYFVLLVMWNRLDKTPSIIRWQHKSTLLHNKQYQKSQLLIIMNIYFLIHASIEQVGFSCGLAELGWAQLDMAPGSRLDIDLLYFRTSDYLSYALLMMDPRSAKTKPSHVSIFKEPANRSLDKVSHMHKPNINGAKKYTLLC